MGHKYDIIAFVGWNIPLEIIHESEHTEPFYYIWSADTGAFYHHIRAARPANAGERRKIR
jgi:hypothetical protein